jgi:3-deoxy-D-manno-octulosonic-acid transferase
MPVIHRAYTLLLYLGVPLALARLYWRGFKAPAYRARWGERFGGFSAPLGAGGVWIHAVSVGEFRAALPLIRALQGRYPSRRLLVTTTTPTGSGQVREVLGDAVDHVYLPYDPFRCKNSGPPLLPPYIVAS